jgi:hypothetical protein
MSRTKFFNLRKSVALGLTVAVSAVLLFVVCGGDGGKDPVGPNGNVTLTVTANPVGSGTVSMSPAGGSHAPGTVVTLVATPIGANQFSSWTGASGGATTTVTMGSTNMSVIANFTPTSSGNVWDNQSCNQGTACVPFTSQSQWDSCPAGNRVPTAGCVPAGSGGNPWDNQSCNASGPCVPITNATDWNNCPLANRFPTASCVPGNNDPWQTGHSCFSSQGNCTPITSQAGWDACLPTSNRVPSSSPLCQSGGGETGEYCYWPASGSDPEACAPIGGEWCTPGENCSAAECMANYGAVIADCANPPSVQWCNWNWGQATINCQPLTNPNAPNEDNPSITQLQACQAHGMVYNTETLCQAGGTGQDQVEFCLWNDGGECWPITAEGSQTVAQRREACARDGWVFRNATQGESTFCLPGGIFTGDGKNDSPPTQQIGVMGCCDWSGEPDNCWGNTSEVGCLGGGGQRWRPGTCGSSDGTCPVPW